MDTPRYRRNLTPPHYEYIDLTPELPPLSARVLQLERVCRKALHLLARYPQHKAQVKHLWQEVRQLSGRQ